MSIKIQELIREFRERNPLKTKTRKQRRSWKERFPDEYEAAKELLMEGRTIGTIARHFNTGHSTLANLFKADGLLPNRNYWMKKTWTAPKVEPGRECPCIYGIPCSVHTVKEGLKHLEANNKG
jgi:hypothetical protein